MDARLLRCAVLVAALCSLGASYRTKNFVVSAPSPELARQIGDMAEKYRHDLAQLWLGEAMPNWSQPCPITAQVGPQLGAGGATSFVFDRGEVFGWRMTIQGSRERILDSVLPHEVTHTVFATHFRQPLPRWADEGACTTVEHPSERAKQQNMLISFLRTGRGIAFSQMFAMKEYPHDVLPLYSQGYSVARYLVQQGGRQKFLAFIRDGLRDENWGRAVNTHYGVESLASLQNEWLGWVRQGSPKLDGAGAQPSLVAVTAPPRSTAAPGPSAQSPIAPAPPVGVEPDTAVQTASATADGPSIYERASTSPDVLQVASSDGRPWRKPDIGPSASAGSASAGGADSPANAQHQVTRPQPMVGPRQIILEWSRPPAASDGSSVAAQSGNWPAAIGQ